jgi:hypothetical protein
MAYKHHHHLSVIVTLVALAALLLTVNMSIDASMLALGIFILYWVLSKLYFDYSKTKIEERMYLTVIGNIFLFLFVSLIAFLSRADILSIVLGILMSTTILLFPLSHSLTPSRELKRIARLPLIKHRYFIPFCSCYRVDLESPNPVYIRDVIGLDEMEISFYLKYPPKTELKKDPIIKELNIEDNRVSIKVDKKTMKNHPTHVLKIVKKIAKELRV